MHISINRYKHNYVETNIYKIEFLSKKKKSFIEIWEKPDTSKMFSFRKFIFLSHNNFLL